jgi:hypothetical protein
MRHNSMMMLQIVLLTNWKQLLSQIFSRIVEIAAVHACNITAAFTQSGKVWISDICATVYFFRYFFLFRDLIINLHKKYRTFYCCDLLCTWSQIFLSRHALVSKLLKCAPVLTDDDLISIRSRTFELFPSRFVKIAISYYSTVFNVDIGISGVYVGSSARPVDRNSDRDSVRDDRWRFRLLRITKCRLETNHVW